MSSADAIRTRHGIFLVIGAVACFAIVDTISKTVGAVVPVVLAMAARFSMQTVITGSILYPRRGRALFHTRHPWLQLARGLLLVLSGSLAFLSLRFMPLGDFTSIQMLTPLVITVISAVALDERVSPLRWMLVFGAFAGALIVIRPEVTDVAWVTLLPLTVVAASVAFQLLTRKLAQVDDAGTMHFYSGCVGMLSTVVLLPFFWHPPTTAFLWGLLFLLGVFGSIGHYLLILGYERATPATLTPFLYGQIAFATLAGWVFFRQAPDHLSVLGILMIAGCGIAATTLSMLAPRRAEVPPVDSE
jgi:drug/metabolite transporter (DMT)-like permease